jgi:hypothetical protein
MGIMKNNNMDQASVAPSRMGDYLTLYKLNGGLIECNIEATPESSYLPPRHQDTKDTPRLIN